MQIAQISCLLFLTICVLSLVILTLFYGFLKCMIGAALPDVPMDKFLGRYSQESLPFLCHRLQSVRRIWGASQLLMLPLQVRELLRMLSKADPSSIDSDTR